MVLLVYYVVMVLLGTVVAAAIGLWLDSISEILSLSVFFTLFFGIIWVAWVIAVRMTEPKAAAETSEAAPSGRPAG